MKPTEAAKRLDLHRDTLKRWLRQYSEFFSYGANPGQGQDRNLHPDDLRILMYIKELRNSGLRYEGIKARLEAEKANSWENLPYLPEFDETVPVEVNQRASELAQSAILSHELQVARAQLAEAHGTIEQLEAQLAELDQEKTGLTSEKHELEVQLERAKSEAARLEGQLSQYTLGRDQPLNVGVIIGAVALVTLALVLVVLVVARLVL